MDIMVKKTQENALNATQAVKIALEVWTMIVLNVSKIISFISENVSTHVLKVIIPTFRRNPALSANTHVSLVMRVLAIVYHA